MDYRIKGFLKEDGRECIIIPIDLDDFYNIIEEIEHKKLSDKIISINDKENEIHVIINDNLILKELHNKVYDIDELKDYLISYAFSLDN